MSLPRLPSYIELRSPSPEPALPFPIEDRNAASDREFSAQQAEEAPTSIGPRSSHITSHGQGHQMVSHKTLSVSSTGYSAILATIPLSEIFCEFLSVDWEDEPHKSASVELGSFELVIAYPEDSLEAFVDRLSKLGSLANRSYMEILFLLMHYGFVSPDHLLEIIVRRGDGNLGEMLKVFALEIDISMVGARALGTAAYLNNFEVVNTLLDEHVDINGLIFNPHSTPNCECEIGVVAYAQLPRFDGGVSGVSDEMIAHLLSRGAIKLAGANTWIFGLLSCMLKDTEINDHVLLPRVQAVVERIHGFADSFCETGSVLETCLVGWELKGNGSGSRLQVFEYLLAQGAKASPGSPLAVLIYRGLPGELFWDLFWKTESINAYCTSLPWNHSIRSVHSGCADIYNSINPLQAAALQANETIVHILLQKGADVNCPGRDLFGVTPLQGICRFRAESPQARRKKTRIVKLLLDSGANVNAAPASRGGNTALQQAAIVGDVEVADFLLSSGADVNAPPCKFGGGTALAIAARNNHEEMVQFLLRAGAAIPAAGFKVSSLGVTNDDNKKILDLLCISAADLSAMYGVNGTPSRDYHEYDAEWAADPTYGNKS